MFVACLRAVVSPLYPLSYPECLFPATWTESAWMTDVIGMTKDVTLINYGFDKSCYTAKSTAPKVKTRKCMLHYGRRSILKSMFWYLSAK